MIRSFMRQEKLIPAFMILAGLGALALAFGIDLMGIGEPGLSNLQIGLLLMGFLASSAGVFLLTPAGQSLLDRLLPQELPEQSARRVLLISIWFGLLAGLLEGISHLVSLRVGDQTGVWFEIVWIATIFNTLVFTVIGLVLALATRLLPRFPFMDISFMAFAFVMYSSLLRVLVGQQIHEYAIWSLATGLAVVSVHSFLKYRLGTLRLIRRSLPAIAALAVLTFVGIQGGFWAGERMALARLPQAPPNSPNILVLMIDTLRADHLSSYGYERPTSPNLDRIASEGVLFEQALAPSSWTLPSHASILTGRYPKEHGVELSNPRGFMDSPHPSIAEALQGLGYRTAAFSANTLWFTREQGFGRGFTRFEDYFTTPADMVWRTSYGGKFYESVMRPLGFIDHPARKRASHINSSVIRWLERDTQTPFFAFVNYFDTHDPYLPPQPYRSQFSATENPGGIINFHLGHPDPIMTPEELQSEIDAYDGAIAYVDDQIGQLLAELQERDLDQNLLLIITSDHGEAFGEHNMLLHANSLYREEIHVPLILWKPGQIPSQVRISRPVTNAALPATIMDFLEDGHQNQFPGPSLAGLWTSVGADSDWPLPLSEREHVPFAPEKFPIHHGAITSAVSPEWHYIEHQTFGAELYDWNNDPREAHNLSDSPEGQSAIEQIKDALVRMLVHE